MAMTFNVTVPFLMSRLVAQHMVDTAGSGSIVNVSSRSSDMVMPSFAAYGAGKAALNQLTRYLAPSSPRWCGSTHCWSAASPRRASRSC